MESPEAPSRQCVKSPYIGGAAVLYSIGAGLMHCTQHHTWIVTEQTTHDWHVGMLPTLPWHAYLIQHSRTTFGVNSCVLAWALFWPLLNAAPILNIKPNTA